jgi:hypothetical protein
MSKPPTLNRLRLPRLSPCPHTRPPTRLEENTARGLGNERALTRVNALADAAVV